VLKGNFTGLVLFEVVLSTCFENRIFTFSKKIPLSKGKTNKMIVILMEMQKIKIN